jgi:hypothetical protein
MNRKQIQLRALEYIANRVAELNDDVKLSRTDEGVPEEELETFIGWFATYEDFKEWALTDSDWDRETCANLPEIYELISKLLHC